MLRRVLPDSWTSPIQYEEWTAVMVSDKLTQAIISILNKLEDFDKASMLKMVKKMGDRKNLILVCRSTKRADEEVKDLFTGLEVTIQKVQVPSIVPYMRVDLS